MDLEAIRPCPASAGPRRRPYPIDTDRRRLVQAALGLAALASRHAFGADAQPALRTRLAELAQEHGVCAAAFATVSGGRVQPALFSATCTPKPPETTLGADTVFQAASLSKPVVAYGALKLVAAGALDLDASVTRYLPDGYDHRRNPFDNHPPAVVVRVPADELKEVTLRMLLNHTSGLPNWANGPLALGFTPGSAWSYSGEGYMLLQKVIEAVTGDTLDVFLDKQVLRPAGMADSSFRPGPALLARLVSGRNAAGQPRRLRFPSPIAAGSLHTTAADYARFMAALLADKPALGLTLADPVTATRRPPLQWGLGWGMERTADGTCLWQWGNNPGYRAFAMMRPASGDGFVLLTNSERGMALAEPLAGIALPGEHPAFGFRLLH